jgi:hypothetical protein
MKYYVVYLAIALVGFSCASSKQGDDGPDLSSMVEGVYKINNIATNGGAGTPVSNPSYNVLVNRNGNTMADMREVVGNTQTVFTAVSLTMNATTANKIEFIQSNGSEVIRGYFLNGALEYTLVKGNTSKVVKANK